MPQILRLFLCVGILLIRMILVRQKKEDLLVKHHRSSPVCNEAISFLDSLLVRLLPPPASEFFMVAMNGGGYHCEALP